MSDPSRSGFDNPTDTEASIGPLELAGAEALRLGEVELRFATLEIVRDGQVQRVAPKAMALLLALCRQRGETVSHERLLDLVWPDDEVTPDVLSRGIRDLRRALGDASPAQSAIQTVPRIGYRLRAELGLTPNAPEPVASVRDEPGPTATAVQLPAPTGPRWLLVTVVGLYLVVLVLAANSWLQRSPVTPIPDAGIAQVLISSNAAEYQPSLSPDGQWLAYVRAEKDNPQLSRAMIAAADGSQARRLNQMSAAQESLPQWANDGRRLAYLRSDALGCRIMLARPLDEPEATPNALSSCPTDAYYPFAWAHQDRGLWLSRPQQHQGVLTVQLSFLDLDGNERLLEYERQPSDLDQAPQPSPDGRWLVFKRGNGVHGDLYLVSTEGGPVRRLTHRDGYYGRVAWYPNSEAIVYSRGALLDRRLYRLALEDGIETALGIGDADHADIAAGKLVYERLRQRAMITEVVIEQGLVGVSLDGHSQGEFAPSTGSNFEAVYAPDGDRVAFISDRSGSQQLWLRESGGQEPRRLTDWPSLRLLDLAWSGDGSRLTVVSIDDQRQINAWILAPRTDGLLTLAQTKRLPLPQRVVAKPRLLSDGKLVWMARFDDGWRAFVAESLEGPFDGAELAGLRGLELGLQIDHQSLYLTDPVRSEILRLDPPYTQTRIVASGLSRWIPGRWRLAAGSVWYVWLEPDQGHSLLYRAPLPGPLDPQPILSLGALRINPVFEIAADAQRLLVRGIADDQTDIATVALPALDAP